MYKIIKNFRFQEIITETLPSFGISIVMAELYYKFGSFTLECIAFLITWCLLGYLINKVKFILDKRAN